MIGNPKNITTSTGLQVGALRKINYTQFISAFFINTDFEFTDLEDFQDQDTWIQGIKNRYIFPLLAIKRAIPQLEEDNYQLSKLDYEYKAYNGKYRYILEYILPIDYIKVLNNFSGQQYSIIFSDVNGYVYAYSPDGTKIKGLGTNLIDFGKIKLGDINPALSPLRIELEDSDQINEQGIIQKFDWPINRLEVIFVSITSVSSSSTDNITFTVKDENFGCPIMGLSTSDIELDDVSGAQTIGGLIEGTPGVYQLSSITPGITNGEIIIDTDLYYGSETYVFTNAAVSISNITYYSATKLRFDVRLDIDSSLITGLLTGDFTVTDDTNGALSIGAFSEVSTGRYELSSLSADMTTGDIDISDATYTGSDPYDLDIDVTIGGTYLAQKIADGANAIIVEVTTTEDGVPVTGLGTGDFSIIDDISGSLTVTGASEAPAGTYTLTTNIARTSGDIDVDTSIYSGTVGYDFEQQTFRNGGAAGTTDWTGAVGGIAEHWAIQAQVNSVASIVTGNGFTGNAQQVYYPAGTSGESLTAIAIFFKPSTNYKLSFKYRSDRTITIDLITNSLSFSDTFYSNIGNAGPYLSAQFTTGAADNGMQILFNNSRSAGQTGYIEIDEVEIIEQ